MCKKEENRPRRSNFHLINGAEAPIMEIVSKLAMCGLTLFSPAVRPESAGIPFHSRNGIYKGNRNTNFK